MSLWNMAKNGPQMAIRFAARFAAGWPFFVLSFAMPHGASQNRRRLSAPFAANLPHSKNALRRAETLILQGFFEYCRICRKLFHKVVQQLKAVFNRIVF